MKRWFVFRTEPRRESKAGVSLSRYGTVYIPMAHRIESKDGWQIPTPDGVLFPGYIFVILETRDTPWFSITRAPGLIDVLRNCRREPMPVPYRFMRSVRHRDRISARKTKAPSLLAGQRVKITAGPFSGFEGVFDAPAKDRVRVLLSIFGAKTETEIDARSVVAA